MSMVKASRSASTLSMRTHNENFLLQKNTNFYLDLNLFTIDSFSLSAIAFELLRFCLEAVLLLRLITCHGLGWGRLTGRMTLISGLQRPAIYLSRTLWFQKIFLRSLRGEVMFFTLGKELPSSLL